MSKQQEKKPPYKPEGLNRILWLVAKNIAIPHPDFGHKDNALFAISQYSGAKFESIHMHIIVDSVINALGEYYEHSGISRYELPELLKTFRTDYAALTNQKWTQDIASEKIIDACMTRMALAQVKDGETVLIDLKGPEVSFKEAWKKADNLGKLVPDIEAELEKPLRYPGCPSYSGYPDGVVASINPLARTATFKFRTDLNGNIPEWLVVGAKVYHNAP